MPRHVIVIGGGFAGLKAAVDLADAGVRVTVLESRTGLGGRARSFIDPVSSEVVDNGQHLFLAGYYETLQFLRRLKTDRHLVFQNRFKVTFVEMGGKVRTLDCPPLPAPWHLIFGLAGLSSLSLRDKLGLNRIARELKSSSGDGNGHPEETVEQWLTRLGQTEKSQIAFWNPLTVATLNEDPSRASFLGLVSVLRTLWLAPWPDARLGVASVGLSDLYTTDASRIIEEKGGVVQLNRPVAGLGTLGSRITTVGLVDGERLEADAVISSVSPSALSRILPRVALSERLRGLLSCFSTSPILSVNLWLDRPVTQELFVGLIGTRFQWLFNKPAILKLAGIEARYINLIISAAHNFIDQSNEMLVRAALEDLRSCFPKARQAQLIRSQVVREREATVSLTVGMEQLRPGPTTDYENFFLAGDWTSTGLPATVESAVRSGKRSAEAALKWLAPLHTGVS